MMDPLISEEEMNDIPGGPHDPSVIAVGSSLVRQYAGWHIAPEVQSTVILDHDGSSILRLPTLKLKSVDSIRSLVDPANPRPLNRWRVSYEKCMIVGRFPRGFGVVEVVFTHGYESCPPDLYRAVAEAGANGRVQTRTAGPFSETLAGVSANDPTGSASVMSLYRLGPRP